MSWIRTHFELNSYLFWYCIPIRFYVEFLLIWCWIPTHLMLNSYSLNVEFLLIWCCIPTRTGVFLLTMLYSYSMWSLIPTQTIVFLLTVMLYSYSLWHCIPTQCNVVFLLTVMLYCMRSLVLRAMSPPCRQLGTQQFSFMAVATSQPRQQGTKKPHIPAGKQTHKHANTQHQYKRNLFCDWNKLIYFGPLNLNTFNIQQRNNQMFRTF